MPVKLPRKTDKMLELIAFTHCARGHILISTIGLMELTDSNEEFWRKLRGTGDGPEPRRGEFDHWYVLSEVIEWLEDFERKCWESGYV